MTDSVFHVELRQFPHQARAFNLTSQELQTRIVEPWLAGREVELNDRRWVPERAKLTIYEGRRLGPEEIGLGRGWANATRTGTDVTAQVLEQTREPSPVERFKDELTRACSLGPVPLSDTISLAGAQHPQARVSERMALAEQALWQLLHEQRLELHRGGAMIAAEQWAPVLLNWDSWTTPDLAIRLSQD